MVCWVLLQVSNSSPSPCIDLLLRHDNHSLLFHHLRLNICRQFQLSHKIKRKIYSITSFGKSYEKNSVCWILMMLFAKIVLTGTMETPWYTWCSRLHPAAPSGGASSLFNAHVPALLPARLGNAACIGSLRFYFKNALWFSLISKSWCHSCKKF